MTETLQLGRDADVAVARALGWTEIRPGELSWSIVGVCLPGERPVEIPNYSTDTDCALKALEEWNITRQGEYQKLVVIRPRFWMPLDCEEGNRRWAVDSAEGSFFATTLPLAICRLIIGTKGGVA